MGAEQAAQRQVDGLAQHVFGVADADGVEAGVEGRAGLSEPAQEFGAQGRAVAEQFLARLRIAEAIAAV
jgi:hypothetical protein